MAGEGLVVDSGRALRARLLAGDAGAAAGGLVWLAIGDGTWDDITGPPVEDPEQTILAHELARKLVDRFAYLEQDPEGVIAFDGDTYSEVAGPTNIIAFFAKFNEDEGVGLEIREEALFADDSIVTNSPYADAIAGEVLAPGTMYWLRNRAIYTKGPADTYSVIAIFREE